MFLIKSSKVYDALKYIAQVALPALGAAYLGLSQIWGFPNGEEVVGSIVVLDTLLGVLLHLSSTEYEKVAKYDGAVQIIDGKTKKTYSLELHDDIEDLDGKKEVVLKVKKPTS